MRLLIVNPYASGVTKERVAKVRAALGDVELEQTTHPGHATELAGSASDAEAIYVFSGDGGLNEVLNGIGPETPVGAIPGGGANVVARVLGLSRDPVQAAKELAKGNTRRSAGSRQRTAFRVLRRPRDRRRGGPAPRRARADGRTWARGQRPLRLGVRADDHRAPRTVRACARDSRSGPGRVCAGREVDPYTYFGPVPIRVAPEARFELGLDLVAPRGVSPASFVPACSATPCSAGDRQRPRTSCTPTISTASRSSAIT